MNHVPTVQGYFRQARFLLSAPRWQDLPPDDGIEILIAGRSNVGKSSVLNALCDQRTLARTSRTPGRTQHVVVFDLQGRRRLLDIPGFGYAAVHRETRKSWEELLPRLLETRQGLRGMLLLADARMPFKQEELHLIEWSVEAGLSVCVALNKTDKLTRQELLKSLREATDTLRQLGVEAPPLAISAASKQGIGELRTALHAWFELGIAEKERPRTDT